MAKKKQHHEEHADETWLLPYSDLLTLLLALFIVMFAMSNMDKQKFKKISEQFNVIFAGGRGFMAKDGASAIPMYPSGGAGAKPITNRASEETMMHEIKERIERQIKKSGYSGKVKVDISEQGLDISIQEAVLFYSGNADVLTSVSPLLLEIAKTLNGLDNNIKVAGHTDNIPIRNAKIRSNWDLSAIRAINVTNFLIENGGLAPERFSIEGYSQYAPKYDNSTEAGRAKNRRVEIFLVRKFLN